MIIKGHKFSPTEAWTTEMFSCIFPRRSVPKEAKYFRLLPQPEKNMQVCAAQQFNKNLIHKNIVFVENTQSVLVRQLYTVLGRDGILVCCGSY